MKKYSLKTRVFGFIKDWFYPIYFIIQLPFAIGACAALTALCFKDRASRIARFLGKIVYIIGGWLIVVLPWWKADNIKEIVDFIHIKSKAKDEKVINIVADEEDE